ncbi:hypothetical protein AMECASPLE_023560 [Ameca splendens]|uniref:Secreted protein n=1 Tax=Ameca splendens TaxID=208324 RepID=A0ABV0XHA7_9TELE
MLRGSSALVSVFLCSVCLVVVLTRSPAPSKKRPCSKEIIIKVTSLRKSLLNQTLVNCTLYTPTIEDYKVLCRYSTKPQRKHPSPQTPPPAAWTPRRSQASRET